ncbi:MAG: GNAT family N-acetyltransferase [Nocardioidaceae bacterium]
MQVRALAVADLDCLLVVQEAGAVAGLSHIFPQDTHPFPREVVRRRWLDEIEDPGVDAYVSIEEGQVNGFAATRDCELLHFGTALDTWGTGLAKQLHDAVLECFAQRLPTDTSHLRLRVFEANLRARRFYEKLGWRLTGERSQTSFPPHPVLVEYHLPWHR